MTNNALGAAVLAATLALSNQAMARMPAPLVPTALVFSNSRKSRTYV
jgi:hypothetical protein